MTEMTFTELLANPARDHCTGKLLSLANELKNAGYKHSDIAEAGLTVALEHALEEGWYEYAHFLRRLEERARARRADLDRIYEESEKDGTLLKR